MDLFLRAKLKLVRPQKKYLGRSLDIDIETDAFCKKKHEQTLFEAKRLLSCQFHQLYSFCHEKSCIFQGQHYESIENMITNFE